MKHRLFNFFVFLLLLPLLLRAQEETWQIIGQMPYPVKGAQAIVKDSLIYVFGGYTDSTYSTTNLIQVFNPSKNEWRIAADTLRFRRYGLSAANYRNSVILFGGTAENDSSLEMWDFMDGTYIYDQNRIFNRQFSTSQVYQNNLYIFGGYVSGYSQSDTIKVPYLIEYYVPGAAVTFSRPSSFSETEYSDQDVIQQMSAIVDQTILVMGGALNGILKDIYTFDIATHEWQKSSWTLFEERAAGAAVTLADGSVAIIGGYNESAPALASGERIYVKDKYIVNMEPLPQLNIARSELTAVFFDSSVYVFGGKDVLGNCASSVEKLKIQPQFTPVRSRSGTIPDKIVLLDNYPNPFNSSTTIKFYVNRTQALSLSIYSITGTRVVTLVNGVLAAGEYSYKWNGKDAYGHDVASGVYFYRLSTATGTQTKRLIVLR